MERRRSATTPSRPATALGQPLDPRERHHEVLFALGGELGRGGLGGGVELGDRGHEVRLALGQAGALGRWPPRAASSRVASSRPTRCRRRARSSSASDAWRPRRGGLALERPDLAAHLPQQVAEPVEVLLGGGQAALGPLAAAPVLQDARPPPR